MAASVDVRAQSAPAVLSNRYTCGMDKQIYSVLCGQGSSNVVGRYMLWPMEPQSISSCEGIKSYGTHLAFCHRP